MEVGNLNLPTVLFRGTPCMSMGVRIHFFESEIFVSLSILGNILIPSLLDNFFIKKILCISLGSPELCSVLSTICDGLC